MKSMHSYRYRVVDVFTDRPLEGNALAVFPDAYGIDVGGHVVPVAEATMTL